MALVRLNVTAPASTNGYLQSLTGKQVGTPPPLDNLNRIGGVVQGNFTYVSINVAANFGFGFGSINGSVDRKVMTFDYAAMANQDDPNNNGIDSWTYAAGYRIGILTFDTEATAQYGLASIAATATLSNKQMQIQVLRYGMPEGPSIPFPDFTNFDVESFGLFTKWQNDVIAYIDVNKSKLDPIRIYASLSIDVEKYFASTAPLRFALRRIQDKQTLTDALKIIKNRQLPELVGYENIVRAVYARITGYGAYLDEAGPIDKQSISDSSKAKAEEWIQQYDK